MEEKEVVCQFLRATLAKFDALTLSLDQYSELGKVSLDEVIGSLIVHDLRLKERESREEEQVLLVKALGKDKISFKKESSSRGRGRHRGCGDETIYVCSLNTHDVVSKKFQTYQF